MASAWEQDCLPEGSFMRIADFVLRAAFIALAAAPAAAQSVAPPAGQSDDEIVVEGTRQGKKPVRDFVRALTDVGYMGQLGRFDAPACPVALGLAPAQNAGIAQRMRRVAAAASLRVAPERCVPNVFVILAPDKKEAIDQLHRRYPAYFSGMNSRQIRALAAKPAPAVAWQVATRLGADGQILKKAANADYYVVEATDVPSRIRAASMPIFVASVVVIDRPASAGLTVTQLADYAAMRTFAATDPERLVRSGAPTILRLLGQPDDQPLPVTLTHWDLGFLKSLYATSNAYYAHYQRGDMERVVAKELARSGDKPPR
jgi:hypothetical protein